MAFDAKQAVIDRLTHLEDELKQARAKQERDAQENALAVAVLTEEIDAWQALLSGSDKPAAKKTASKK